MARTELTGQTWVAGFFLVFAGLASTYFVFRLSAGTWLEVVVSATLACACAMASLDVLWTRVRPDGAFIVIRRLVGSRRIPFQTVKGVAWEKGQPVAIQLDDNTWIHLPECLPGGPGTVSTIRAWIARSQPSEHVA